MTEKKRKKKTKSKRTVESAKKPKQSLCTIAARELGQSRSRARNQAPPLNASLAPVLCSVHFLLIREQIANRYEALLFIMCCTADTTRCWRFIYKLVMSFRAWSSSSQIAFTFTFSLYNSSGGRRSRGPEEKSFSGRKRKYEGGKK